MNNDDKILRIMELVSEEHTPAFIDENCDPDCKLCEAYRLAVELADSKGLLG